MTYTDKIREYANSAPAFVEIVYSPEQEREMSKKLGITEDDYPKIPRPIFLKYDEIPCFIKTWSFICGVVF